MNTKEFLTIKDNWIKGFETTWKIPTRENRQKFHELVNKFILLSTDNDTFKVYENIFTFEFITLLKAAETAEEFKYIIALAAEKIDYTSQALRIATVEEIEEDAAALGEEDADVLFFRKNFKPFYKNLLFMVEPK